LVRDIAPSVHRNAKRAQFKNCVHGTEKETIQRRCHRVLVNRKLDLKVQTDKRVVVR